jgi:hypothetical protein
MKKLICGARLIENLKLSGERKLEFVGVFSKAAM